MILTCCCGQRFPNRKELYVHLSEAQAPWSAFIDHAEPPKPGARVRLVQRDTAGDPPYGTEGTVVVEVGGTPNFGVRFDDWHQGHALGGVYGPRPTDDQCWWCRARQLEVLP